MKKVEVKIYTDQGNNAVLHLPNRHYPGVVIQGDSLLNLTNVAAALLEKVRVLNDEELIDEAEEVFFGLSEILEEFKVAVKNAGVEVPYLK